MISSIAIRKYRETDAAELLRMWKESQSGWPAGMSTASGNSPAEFHRNLMQGIELAHFIAEDTAAGRIVGYAGFSSDPADLRFSLLPLLNVHPEWQKCGIGQMLIAAVVDEAVEHGFHWVSLGTWPGNMYAVGLYKRCGFYWVPETEIYMVNFMPLIRSTPFLHPFFERHNWYDSFRVEKTPEPDDHKIGKMKVYHYRFEGPDQTMSITIDRNAAAVSGLDTGSERLELLVDDSEGLRGLNRHIICRIRNMQAGPMEGVVRFEGRHGLTPEGRDNLTTEGRDNLTPQGQYHLIPEDSRTFRLEPGDEWIREFDVGIPCELENPRHGPKPSVAAVISLNGCDVTLEAGLKTELPVECSFHDDDVFLPEGRVVRRVLNVENRLTVPVSLDLAFVHGDNLVVTPDALAVDLPACTQEGFPLDLAATPGRHGLQINIVDKSCPDRPLPVVKRELCCRSFGGTGWIDARDQILVRNEHFRVIAGRQTGRVMILDTRYDAGISLSLPDAGPPFPFKATESDPVITCESTDGHLVVSVTGHSMTFRGVTRVMKLVIGESPMIRVSGHLIARDGGMVVPRLRQCVTAGYRHSETVIPTRDGIISHSDASFPFGLQDLPHDPACYPETWCMLRYRRNIAGFVWTGKPDDIRFTEWKILMLNYHDIAIEPGKPWIMPDSYVWVGPGDEQTVRDMWSGLSGRKSELQLQQQPLIGFDREIAPLIVQGRQQVNLPFRNRREFSESGSLILSGNPAAGLRRRVLPLPELNRGNSGKVVLTMRPRVRHPTATSLSGTFAGTAFDVPFKIPTILFPEAERAVRIDETRRHDMDAFRIVNGRLSLEVVPAFHGVLTSFEYDGVPLLRSPFPDTGVFGFESPWYGGVTPEIRLVSHEESKTGWTGSRVAVTDSRGLEWQGVRLDSGVIPDEKKHRLAAALDYLTLPGCPILAARMTIRNTGTTVAHPVIMLLVFPGIRGEPFDHVAFRKFGQNTTRHRSERRGVFPFENWIGFASSKGKASNNGKQSVAEKSPADDSPSFAVIHANPFRGVSPLLIDAGTVGSYIYAYEALKLDPGEKFHITHFLIPFEGEAVGAAGFESLRNLEFV